MLGRNVEVILYEDAAVQLRECGDVHGRKLWTALLMLWRGFPHQMGHYFSDIGNKVEPQKQNQTAREQVPFGLVFGV